jgi:hypothetical protein
MAYPRALATALAAAALLAGDPGPASAQCRLCANPTTQLGQSERGGAIRLQVEASLDFDRLVLLGSGDGEATLLPNGERSASGSIAALSASAMVGTVTVHGEGGRAIRVEMPPSIELFSVSGARIAIDSIRTDLPPAPKLDSDGNLSFRFGGRLQIDGNGEGEFRGEVPITVDYL